jgi:actin-like ATPase involved in cell morphogenesis/predicted DNA-binding protein
MGYVLGVDLGTTWSAAAVVVDGVARPLALDGRGVATSSVVAREGDAFVVGDLAQRRLRVAPTSGAREVKRRLGDPVPFVLDGAPFGAEALLGRILAFVVERAVDELGGAPASVVLSHPATWGEYKLGLLREASRSAGLASVVLVTEPAAAAIHYAELGRVAVDDVVAVYDFGGGTFDSTVLHRTGTGFELMGEPQGLDRLGGVDIDHAVFAHVDRTLDGALVGVDRSDPSTAAAVSRVREECTAAKEALSDDTEATIPVNLPGLTTQVRLTRGELESMVRPRLEETATALEAAVASAGLQMDDITTILLVGGTARMPVVAEFVASRWGRPTARDAHPKLAVALGAATHGWHLARLAEPAAAQDGEPPDDDRRRTVDLLAAAALATERGGAPGQTVSPSATGAVASGGAPAVAPTTPSHATGAGDGGGVGGRIAAAAAAASAATAGAGAVYFAQRDNDDASSDRIGDADGGDDSIGSTPRSGPATATTDGVPGGAAAIDTPADAGTVDEDARPDPPTAPSAATTSGADAGTADTTTIAVDPTVGAPSLDILDDIAPPPASTGRPTDTEAPSRREPDRIIPPPTPSSTDAADEPAVDPVTPDEAPQPRPTAAPRPAPTPPPRTDRDDTPAERDTPVERDAPVDRAAPTPPSAEPDARVPADPTTPPAQPDARVHPAPVDEPAGGPDRVPADTPAPMPAPDDASHGPVGQPAATGPTADDLAEFIQVARASVAALDPEGADPARLAALREDLGNLLDRARPGEGETYADVIAEVQAEIRDQIARFDRSERLDDQLDQAAAAQDARQAAIDHVKAIEQEIQIRNAALAEANARYLGFRDELVVYVSNFTENNDAISQSEAAVIRQQVDAVLLNVQPLSIDDVNQVRARQDEMLATTERILLKQRNDQYQAKFDADARASDERVRQVLENPLNHLPFVVPEGQERIHQAVQNGLADRGRLDAELRDRLDDPLMPADAREAILSQLSPTEELYDADMLKMPPEQAAQARALQASNEAWLAEQEAANAGRYDNDEIEERAGEVANLAQGTLPDGSVDEAALAAAEARLAEAQARYDASHPDDSDDSADAAPDSAPSPSPPPPMETAPAGDDLAGFQQRMHRQIDDWEPPEGADPARAEALRERLHGLVDGAQPTNGQTVEETIEEFTMDMRDEMEDYTNVERVEHAGREQQASAAEVQMARDRQRWTAAEVEIATEAYQTAQTQFDDYREQVRQVVREFSAPGISEENLQRMRDGAMQQIDGWPPVPPDKVNDVRGAQMLMFDGVYSSLETTRNEIYRAQADAQRAADMNSDLPVEVKAAAFDRRSEELAALLEQPVLSPEANERAGNALAPPDQQLYDYVGVDPATAAEQRRATNPFSHDATIEFGGMAGPAEPAPPNPLEVDDMIEFGGMAGPAEPAPPNPAYSDPMIEFGGMAGPSGAQASPSSYRGFAATPSEADPDDTPAAPAASKVFDAFDMADNSESLATMIAPDVPSIDARDLAPPSAATPPTDEPIERGTTTMPADAFDDPLGVQPYVTDMAPTDGTVTPVATPMTDDWPDTTPPVTPAPRATTDDLDDVALDDVALDDVALDDDALGLGAVQTDVDAVMAQGVGVPDADLDADADATDGATTTDAQTIDVSTTADGASAWSGGDPYEYAVPVDAPTQPEFDASAVTYEPAAADAPPPDDEVEADDPLFTDDDLTGNLPDT